MQCNESIHYLPAGKGWWTRLPAGRRREGGTTVRVHSLLRAGGRRITFYQSMYYCRWIASVDALGRFPAAVRATLLALLHPYAFPAFPLSHTSSIKPHAALRVAERKVFFVARKGWSSSRLGVGCQDKGEGGGGGGLYGGASLHRACSVLSPSTLSGALCVHDIGLREECVVLYSPKKTCPRWWTERATCFESRGFRGGRGGVRNRSIISRGMGGGGVGCAAVDAGQSKYRQISIFFYAYLRFYYKSGKRGPGGGDCFHYFYHLSCLVYSASFEGELRGCRMMTRGACRPPQAG